MIYDLHNDLFTSTLPRGSYRSYVLNAANSSVRALVLALWTTRLKIDSAALLRLLQPFKGLKTDTLVRCAIEDLHFITEDTLSLLSVAPLSYVGLTWNYDNALAGGANGTSGLSKLGRKAIERAVKSGIAIDTAHLNRKSFFQVADCCEGKLMNSHCCLDAVHPHPRNLTDEQISLLIERGGIVGLTLERSFLSSSRAQTEDVIAHIDHFAQRFGVDNLAIGTDFNGGNPPEELNSYECFELFGSRLKNRGYTGGDVDKIFYKNAAKFFNDKL